MDERDIGGMDDSELEEFVDAKIREIIENAVPYIFAKCRVKMDTEKDVSDLADQKKFFAIEAGVGRLAGVITCADLERKVKHLLREKHGAWLDRKIEELKRKLGDDMD